MVQNETESSEPDPEDIPAAFADPEDVAAIKEIAARTGRSAAEIIREGIRNAALANRVWDEPFFPRTVRRREPRQPDGLDTLKAPARVPDSFPPISPALPALALLMPYLPALRVNHDRLLKVTKGMQANLQMPALVKQLEALRGSALVDRRYFCAFIEREQLRPEDESALEDMVRKGLITDVGDRPE